MGSGLYFLVKIMTVVYWINHHIFVLTPLLYLKALSICFLRVLRKLPLDQHSYRRGNLLSSILLRVRLLLGITAEVEKTSFLQATSSWMFYKNFFVIIDSQIPNRLASSPQLLLRSHNLSQSLLPSISRKTLIRQSFTASCVLTSLTM